MHENQLKAVERVTKLIDIPQNISAELERLHQIINKSSDCDRMWAIKTIDRIHKMLFTGVMHVKGESDE